MTLWDAAIVDKTKRDRHALQRGKTKIPFQKKKSRSFPTTINVPLERCRPEHVLRVHRKSGKKIKKTALTTTARRTNCAVGGRGLFLTTNGRPLRRSTISPVPL